MDAFYRRFAQRTEPKHTSAHLLTLRQARDESINDFVTRFNVESLKVEDVNDLLVISAFQNGIQPGALYKEIMKHDPRTTSELWRIVDQFARADDANRKKREAGKAEFSDKNSKGEDRNRTSALDRLLRSSMQSRLGPQREPIESRLGPRQGTEHN